MTALREHYLSLSEELGVRTEFLSGYGALRRGESFSALRLVKTPEIIAPWEHFSYAVAMHELGHIANDHRLDIVDIILPRPDPVVRFELEAWDWAKQNALVPLDTLAVTTGLGSYMELVPEAWDWRSQNSRRFFPLESEFGSAEDWAATWRIERHQPDLYVPIYGEGDVDALAA